MRMQKMFLKTFIICLILLSGCDEKRLNFSEKANNKIENNLKASAETVSMGIEIDDESKLNEDRKSFLITNKKFSPNIKITNEFPHKNTYSIMFLLNYKQIPMSHNNDEKLVIKETIDARSAKEINIKVPVIETGTHEFLVLVVRESERHLSKKQYIPSEMVNLYLRGTLIVNGSNTLPNLNLVEKEVDSTNSMPEGTVFITEPQNVDPLSFVELDYGNAKLNLNYYNDKPKDIYVGVFQDNKQIDINNSFLKLSESGTLQLPFNINLDTINHELMGIIVENPFAATGSEQGDVIFTNKITIKTE
ncbi:hypothetical protein IHV12_19785 [Fictibacillus sp. 7GRE50]|uniref:hypothetical protein n=1 Tax=Fictibacillus sp. 7GRE50 TaxID=2745878 RepID=UPI0018CF1256|nr:hypothetical protein [Fictibacillus sp. 7GRE50]MBH0167170.1 hypothetical protein [Fictibacillus sp. 7GRE50]